MTLTLVHLQSSGQRKNIPITRPKTVIGRRPECDIRIPRAEISRQHCQIFQDGNAFKIKDLGSSNGTFLNSEKVMEAVIEAGDRLIVGRTVFMVQIDGQPQNIKQPRVQPQQEEEEIPVAQAIDTNDTTQASTIDQAVDELLTFDDDDDDLDDFEPLDDFASLDDKP